MHHHFTPISSGLLLSAGLVLACSTSEAPAENHIPTSFSVAVNGGGAVTDDTLRLAAGGSDSVRITFINSDNENLDVAEAEHYSLLTFTPAAGITASIDPGHHFRQEVVNTAVAGTTGTLDIGYGHDALADEYTFSLKFKVE